MVECTYGLNLLYIAHTNGFAGRHVRVCYGTTKYCNAFLKGLPCNNQDCLYLHDIGMFSSSLPQLCAVAHTAVPFTAEEEISFTKEEMANIGPAKFAGHTGVLPTGGSMRRVQLDEAPDTPSLAGTPHHHMQPEMSLPIAVPRAGSRPDSLWDGGLLGGPASPGAAARAGSWASTLLGVPGQPPAVDSTADFPELSAAPPDSARTPPPPANGATMAEQLARAAAGPGTPLTAASRLKARKEESVRKMQPISPAAKGGRASRLGASASSLSELEGSRPGSGQHDGSEGDVNGQGEDAQHLAATMTWQVIDGDAAALERDVAALGGKGGKRAPPPGFEHLGPTSHPLADDAGDVRQARLLLQYSLEAILAAAEVPLPTYGRMATQSRFGFARRNGEAHCAPTVAQQQAVGQMGMQLLRQLQGAGQPTAGLDGLLADGLYGASAAQAAVSNWK